jgi:hypothetical protein
MRTLIAFAMPLAFILGAGTIGPNHDIEVADFSLYGFSKKSAFNNLLAEYNIFFCNNTTVLN